MVNSLFSNYSLLYSLSDRNRHSNKFSVTLSNNDELLLKAFFSPFNIFFLLDMQFLLILIFPRTKKDDESKDASGNIEN